MTEPKKKDRKKPKGLRADNRIARHFRYKDLNNMSQRKCVYGRTPAEAEKNKQDFKAAVAMARRMDQQGRTVASWASQWLQSKKHLSASTYAGYANDVGILLSALGTRTLQSIMPLDLHNLMAARSGKSASSIAKTAMTIRAVFGAAAENRLIPFDPSARLKGPKGTRGSHRALSAQEQAIVEKVAGTHRFGYAVMLMLWAGLRRQEACAFRAEDCVEGRELSITQAIEWIGNRPFIKPPKSEAGIRKVPVWPALRPFLVKTGYAAQPAGGSDKLITLTAFERGFESFCSACDVQLNGCSKRWQPEGHIWKTLGLRTHDLRHTWFTMLYDTGVDVKVASAWGGHSDIMVTQRIYMHIREHRKRQEALKSMRSGGQNGGQKKTYRIKTK